MRETIFHSSIKAFFITLFSMVGIGLGFIPVFLIFALLFSGSATDIKPKSEYSFEVVPNAEGSRKIHSKDSPVILQLNIRGVIGTELLNMQTIRDQLTESREKTFKKSRVKAVLLNINSPGGTVVDSDGIYHAIKAYKEFYKVPVYAYVDGLCASGGMYIASAADKVYASNVSLIGSVGVISPSFMNFTGLLGKVGVDTLTISAGKDKDELNPLRVWKPGEGENIRRIIESYYGQFVDIVLGARPNLSREKLVDDYGARVYTAQKAEEFGFIDGANKSVNDVIKLLTKEIGIEDSYYQVVQPEGKNWLSTLISGKSPLFTGKISHQFDLGAELSPELRNQFLYLYRPDR